MTVLTVEGDAGSVGITGYFDVDADLANADWPAPGSTED